jgi:thiol-disulfide isomerase/thioredoxin
MANAKQRSAAQRREQVKQQRDQRLNTKQTAQVNKRKRVAKSNPWPIIGGIVAAVAIVVGIFFYLSNQQSTQTANGATTALKTLTSIDNSTLAAVGPGSANSGLLTPLSGVSELKGSDGKPVILYVGAEYCPYCAAQRWGMINALSRFGTFNGVQPITSSEDSVPTFSFHGATYTSQYIDFIGRETGDQNNNPLDSLTAQQQQIFSTYDKAPYTGKDATTGAIPFIDIANQRISAGAYYDPTVLIGHSYQDIATQLKDPNSDIAKGALGTANYLTAGICLATNNQPANVCSANPIPSLETSLSQTSLNSGSSQIAAAALPQVADVRRQD